MPNRKSKRKRTAGAGGKVSPTVRDVGRMWLAEEKAELKASTVWRYSYLLECQIYPKLGDVRIRDLTQETVQEFTKEIKQTGRINGSAPLSDNYVSSIVGVLSDLQEYAVKKKMCQPFIFPVNKPGMKKTRHTILGVGKIRQLLICLNASQETAAAGITITLYAGLRVGEVCALQWKDIDLENGILTVRQTVQRVKKGDGADGSYLRLDRPKTPCSMREIPLHPRLFSLLKEQEEKDGNLFVLTGTEKFMNPATYEYQYHRMMKKAGVTDVNYHTLRHSFTTICVEEGVDIKALSEILGHAKVATTLDIYTHPSINMKKREILKLPVFDNRQTNNQR